MNIFIIFVNTMQDSNETPQISYKQLRSFKDRCEKLYKIRPKDTSKGLINFKFHDAQKILDKVVEEEFARSEKHFGAQQCRLIILKPRQMGSTTYFSARLFDMLMNVELCYSLLIANDIKTSDLVYDIAKRFYNKSPSEVQLVDKNGDPITNQDGTPVLIEFKPEEQNYSGKKLVVGPEGEESRLDIQTAGAEGDVGVGGTINVFVGTEVSRWSDLNGTMDSVSPSFTETGTLLHVLESTANGISGKGEAFYKTWKKSVANWERFKSGKEKVYRGLRPVFIPWWLIPEYRLPLAGGRYIEIDDNNCDFGGKDDKEEFFKTEQMLLNGVKHPLTGETYKVPKEAINWYRHAVINIKDGILRNAKKDYPTFPKDAFHSTDNCYFNTRELHRVENEFEKNPPENEFDVGKLEFDENGDLEFIKQGSGNLYIKEFPDPNYTNRYIISLDESEGHEDGDYSCMFVYDRLEERFVAKWYGKEPEDILAKKFINLGLFYNEAILAPERTFTTVVNITNPDSTIDPYVGPYYYTLVGKSSDLRWGHLMKEQSRDMTLSGYRKWLRGNYDKIFDMSSLKEHQSFVRHTKKGSKRGYKYEASDGNHDDQIIAKAIAVHVSKQWEDPVEEYKPTEREQLLRPRKSQIKAKKQSQLGSNGTSDKVLSRDSKQSSIGRRN